MSEQKSILDLANEHLLARVPAPAKKPVFGTGNFHKKVVSEALAVHPDQIEESRAYDQQLGVAVPHYDEHGRPHFDNSAHMRAYCKRRGLRHHGYT